ncbi:MAG TPA: AI-2E family transporter, partial [Chitinophagaceae bacterium]
AIFAVLGYWIFGVQDPMFWGIVTGFMSVLLVIGTAIVWIPISIYLFMSGMTWHGIGMLIWGILVIANLDNVFRLMWQKKIADVHPLITVFGVLIGIPMFGFVGLIFGPLVISLFILLLKIYWDEFALAKRSIRIIKK